MSQQPQITFQVKLYDITQVLGNRLPDSLSNVLLTLNSQTINIPGAWTFRHGDTFSVSASRGNYLLSVYGNYLTQIANPTPPVPDFTYSLSSGQAPLTVKFYDNSTNSPTYWDWDAGADGTYEMNGSSRPAYTFTSPGTYSVALTAGNGGGEARIVKSNIITVTGVVAPSPPNNNAGSSYSFDFTSADNSQYLMFI